MKGSKIRVTAAIVSLAAALGCLAAGGFRTHKIYDVDAGDYGVRVFHRVTDLQLVLDTTFGGVTRRGPRLYTTYDRSAPRGKRSCPT